MTKELVLNNVNMIAYNDRACGRKASDLTFVISFLNSIIFVK